MDESQVDELDGEDEVDEVDPDQPSYEDLVKELAKTREEAKNRRLTNKQKDVELQRKAAEYDRIQLEAMSEVDRAKKEADDLRAVLEEIQRERTQKAVAKKAGLDEEFADRVRGDSEAEMLADAKALAAKFKSAQSAGTGPLAGSRGAPVGANSPEDLSEQFRQFLTTAGELE